MKRWLLAATAGFLVLGGCSSTEPLPLRVLSFTAMGTIGEIELPPKTKDEAQTLATVRETVEAIEADFSIYRPESLVSRLARGETVTLNERQARLFALADELVKASDGAFDPTIGPLMHLWGFRGGTAPTQPSPETLAEIRALTGWDRVVEISNRTVRLTVPGAKLDFGGLAKGFAVDEAYEAVSATNILLNLGGNIRARGTAYPEKTADWTVSVRDPFQPYGEHEIALLSLEQGMAVATSGNYEQFVEIEGQRYTHILDPRTGMPVRGLAQVTLLAPSAALADGLSTACFILGPEASKKLLARYPKVSALFVPDEEHGGLKAEVEVGAKLPRLFLL